jgi:hypothetical protein
MRFECSANEAWKRLTNPHAAGRDFRGDGLQRRVRQGRIPRTAAVMPVTVGKIGELAWHFHGEGAGLLPSPYGIYLPGRQPPSHTIFIRALCTTAAASAPTARKPSHSVNRKFGSDPISNAHKLWDCRQLTKCLRFFGYIASKTYKHSLKF